MTTRGGTRPRHARRHAPRVLGGRGGGRVPAARRRGGGGDAAPRTATACASSAIVDLVRARHEGAKFDSDVFLIEKGVLPAQVSQAAHVRVTRVEPRGVRSAAARSARPARGGSATRDSALLRRDGAPAAHRPLAGRGARLREPGFPGRDARSARQHLGHLRRRHQDELRDFPPAEPLPQRGPRR